MATDPRIEKYKQLINNGVDPQRAKRLLQQSQQQTQPSQQSTGKKIAQGAGEVGVGFAQGISDVGQRTALRPVEKVMESGIFDKPAQALAKGTAGFLNLFSKSNRFKVKEDAPTFSEYVKGGGAEGDIRESVLGKERADKMTTKVGRGLGQFAGEAALTAPIGAAAGSLAKAGSAATKLGGFARGALAGGVTGGAGTQIGMLGSSDRLATAKETAVGAALGGALGGVAGAKAASKTQKLRGVMSERLTTKAKEEALQSGNLKVKRGVLGGQTAEINPTERLVNAEKVIRSDIKRFSTKPEKLADQIGQLGKKKYVSLSNDLKNMKIGTMTKDKAELTKQIRGIVDDSDWSSFFKGTTKKNQINEVINRIDKAKTADDLWNARIAFDKLMRGPAKSKTYQGETIAEVWKDVRNAMNTKLDDIVMKQGGEGVRRQFFDMSSLIEARDNIITRAARELGPKSGVVTKKQLLKWLAGAGATVGGGALIGKSLQ